MDVATRQAALMRSNKQYQIKIAAEFDSFLRSSLTLKMPSSTDFVMINDLADQIKEFLHIFIFIIVALWGYWCIIMFKFKYKTLLIVCAAVILPCIMFYLLKMPQKNLDYAQNIRVEFSDFKLDHTNPVYPVQAIATAHYYNSSETRIRYFFLCETGNVVYSYNYERVTDLRKK
jgi:hypothetical protein